jgi:hypothetical protein
MYLLWHSCTEYDTQDSGDCDTVSDRMYATIECNILMDSNGKFGDCVQLLLVSIVSVHCVSCLHVSVYETVEMPRHVCVCYTSYNGETACCIQIA